LQPSSGYIVGFAAAVCFVCALLVSSSAVLLEDRQVENKRLDLQKKILLVSDLMKEGESLSREEITRRYEENVIGRVVNLESGSYTEGIDPTTYNQRKAAQDPERSRPAPENAAKVRRLPNDAVVFVLGGDEPEAVILPIEGQGLWSTLYGYIALDADTRTIRNIVFYQHGETPGLGGEVDNPRWKALWRGRLAFDDGWEPAIKVKKGQAGSPEDDPYQVDGLSGATITSNGVTKLVQFWLGEDGFGPYLEAFRGGTLSSNANAKAQAVALHREARR